jgi:hypothetical protein
MRPMSFKPNQFVGLPVDEFEATHHQFAATPERPMSWRTFLAAQQRRVSAEFVGVSVLASSPSITTLVQRETRRRTLWLGPRTGHYSRNYRTNRRGQVHQKRARSWCYLLYYAVCAALGFSSRSSPPPPVVDPPPYPPVPPLPLRHPRRHPGRSLPSPDT